MSVKCSRTFTLREAAAASTVFAYFKLDEASPCATLVDQVSAANLTLGLGTGVSLPGKLGTSIELGSKTPSRQWNSAAGSHYTFDGDFTIRFWMKPAFDFQNQIILNQDQFDVWFMANLWVPGDITMSFYVDTTPGNSALDMTTPLVLGDWNHVMLWYEDGVGIYGQINNGAVESGTGTSPITADASTVLKITDSRFMASNAFDELAIWKRVLTPAERAYDYNSGTGRTYPDVP